MGTGRERKGEWKIETGKEGLIVGGIRWGKEIWRIARVYTTAH